MSTAEHPYLSSTRRSIAEEQVNVSINVSYLTLHRSSFIFSAVGRYFCSHERTRRDDDDDDDDDSKYRFKYGTCVYVYRYIHKYMLSTYAAEFQGSKVCHARSYTYNAQNLELANSDFAWNKYLLTVSILRIVNWVSRPHNSPTRNSLCSWRKPLTLFEKILVG